METQILHRGDLAEVLRQVLHHNPATAVVHGPLLPSPAGFVRVILPHGVGGVVANGPVVG
jgi:hypothetical protein